MKRYEDMTREERIAISDKIFVDELEESLRRNIKQKHGMDIKKGELSELIEEFFKRRIRIEIKKKQGSEKK